MKLAIGDKGPAEIVWDYEGTPVTLSPVFGTVELTIEDQISNVDAVFMGTLVGLSVPMTRSTLAQLEETIAYDVLGSRAGQVITINNVAGCDMYANAKQVVIVPMCNNTPDTDPASWTLLYKCYPYRTINLGFDRGTQRIHQGMISGSTPITGIC